VQQGVQAHTLWGVDGGIEVLHDHVGVLVGQVGRDEAKQHPTSNIHVVGLHCSEDDPWQGVVVVEDFLAGTDKVTEQAVQDTLQQFHIQDQGKTT
jgi:hypothetical protein